MRTALLRLCLAASCSLSTCAIPTASHQVPQAIGCSLAANAHLSVVLPKHPNASMSQKAQSLMRKHLSDCKGWTVLTAESDEDHHPDNHYFLTADITIPGTDAVPLAVESPEYYSLRFRLFLYGTESMVYDQTTTVKNNAYESESGYMRIVSSEELLLEKGIGTGMKKLIRNCGCSEK